MTFRFLNIVGLVLFSFFTHASAAKAAEDKLPEIVVFGDKIPDPNEKIGSYNQPRWTESRSFTNSRVYVIPEGTLEAEYWIVEKTDRPSGSKYYMFQKEVEVGVGHGLQLDFYQNDQTGLGNNTESLEGYQLEMRWALAKWGEIFLNPTLYFEYHPIETDPIDGNSDRVEVKLLLGDDFGRGWRFTSNFAFETQLWGEVRRELEITAGVAHKISNPLMAGIEVKVEGSDALATRGSIVWEYYVGPSLRWTPIAHTNVLLAHLIGTNGNSNLNETTVIFGLEI